MRLELCRAREGTHFVIAICGAKGDVLGVPLSQQLSNQIEVMLLIEGIRTDLPILEKGG